MEEGRTMTILESAAVELDAFAIGCAEAMSDDADESKLHRAREAKDKLLGMISQLEAENWELNDELEHACEHSTCEECSTIFPDDRTDFCEVCDELFCTNCLASHKCVPIYL